MRLSLFSDCVKFNLKLDLPTVDKVQGQGRSHQVWSGQAHSACVSALQVGGLGLGAYSLRKVLRLWDCF